MAHPWIFESSFEDVTTPFGWDTHTDADDPDQLDVATYKVLSQHPKLTPYRGASCMRIRLTGSTTSAILIEGSIDIANTVNRFVRFYLFFSPDFTATAADDVPLFEFQGTGNAREAVIGFSITDAGVITLGIGQTVPTTQQMAGPIKKGVWYCIEMDVTIQTGGTGTIDLFVTEDGKPSSLTTSTTQVGSLTHTAVLRGVIGIQNTLTTTLGTILIDRFTFDEARIFPDEEAFPESQTITMNGHAFVGQGRFDITLMPENDDNVLRVWDSADANVSGSQLVTQLVANSELESVILKNIEVSRGCYLDFDGTTPKALVKIHSAALYSRANLHDLAISG